MRKGFCSLAVIALAPIFAGCGARPAVRPPAALDVALHQPEVAAWFTEHSAPRVLEGMPHLQAQAWRRYQPDRSVDLVWEGLLVHLDSNFGPQPRQLEVTVDRRTGEVIKVKTKNK